MVNLNKLIFSLSWLLGRNALRIGSQIDHEQFVLTTTPQPKSIAIIGAGSSGLSSLKTFIDVSESTGQNWEIVVFERREDVGGIWYVFCANVNRTECTLTDFL